jgi:hypothetical protein
MEVVALGGALQVRVVGADPGQCRESAGRAVKHTAGLIVVGALQERGCLPGEEFQDPRPNRDAARCAVHALVPQARGLQRPDTTGADPASCAAGDVEVVGRVLSLEHRNDRGGTLDRPDIPRGHDLLMVAAPQRGGRVVITREPQ